MKSTLLLGAAVLLSPISGWAQTPATQPEPAPIYRITVVARTLKAVNYQHRTGPTKIDFKGTVLMPQAHGEATVESSQGRVMIDSKFDHLEPPTRFGQEYLAYVLWAITPEGRPKNLGEVIVDGSNHAKLHVSTDLQAFGLMVTAEPYYSVTRPSDVVVMENQVRPDTVGKVEEVTAKYDLLPRGTYVYNIQPTNLKSISADTPKLPMDRYEAVLELYQAQNAVQMARAIGADRYASSSYNKAETLLNQAQDFQARKVDPKLIVTTAREAAQMAEDARTIAIKRQEEERIANEREQATREKAEANATNAAAQAAADRARADAERAARDRAEAEAARSAALAARAQTQQVVNARAATAEADRLRQEAAAQKSQRRVQLIQQLNGALATRDTARGIVVTVPDTLFDSASATLQAGGSDKLARIASILSAWPGLKIEAEGHTDNSGTESYNQIISDRRAQAVRSFLINQGLPASSISARGFGSSRPLASNTTAAGREQNRRVEIIISGDPIGTLANWDKTYSVAPAR